MNHMIKVELYYLSHELIVDQELGIFVHDVLVPSYTRSKSRQHGKTFKFLVKKIE